MQALPALRTAARTLRENPVIIVGVFSLSVIGSLTTIGQLGGGLIIFGSGLVSFLLNPLLAGGVLGMAEEAIIGTKGTTLSTLLAEGRANYLSLLGATVIQLILFSGIGLIWVVITIGGGADVLWGIGLAALIGILAFYFLQFYKVAIVVSGTGAVGAFGRSFRFVRDHPVSVVGYTILSQGINVLVLGSTYWLIYGTPLSVAEAQTAFQRFAGGMTLGSVLPLVGTTLIVGTFVSSLLLTYQVTYYTNTGSEPPDQNLS